MNGEITPPAAALTVEQVTLDQWLGLRDQVVGQVRRLVYLWFANGLGSQRELAKHLNVSAGTVSYHVKALRSANELTEEQYPERPEQKRTNFVRPVENPHPTPAKALQPTPITHRSEPIEIERVMTGVRELGPDEYTHKDYNQIIQLFEQIDNLIHANHSNDNFSTDEWISLLGTWQGVGVGIRTKCDYIERVESYRSEAITVDCSQE